MQTGVVPFHGKALLTAKDVESGKIYVAMKPIVENMGLSWSTQTEKLKSDQRYSLIEIPFETKGGIQEMLSLPLAQLAGYLFSINPNKVREDLRGTIIAYQRETMDAINSYWMKGYASRAEYAARKQLNPTAPNTIRLKKQPTGTYISQSRELIKDLDLALIMGYVNVHSVRKLVRTLIKNHHIQEPLTNMEHYTEAFYLTSDQARAVIHHSMHQDKDSILGHLDNIFASEERAAEPNLLDFMEEA